MEIKALIPKNYKSGKYILGKYKLSDFIFLWGFIVFALLMLIITAITEKFSVGVLLLLVLLVLIPAILTLPISIYHNPMIYLKQVIIYRNKPKKYYWKGIHEYEDI